ncbi:hypothetical protein IX317_000650 [Fusobacterium sp. DD29]|nr:hypothetical protein [Fusobacterium sp. DD45]MBR8710517.1 hypothetical protein [Fusobacterium sp. DD28]MBR8748989.1 hypothetical protein [Fusobacterium sp. DD29]MBR8751033.1 hypothetical protein [Fusobacterium sp. DD26]MBR8761295.1 hypothetical protein [Fusobacterium sp. DD25]MBR8767213.1 hypothetical protein [Fusobacterium sp. DD43]MBR8771318.1 hypothetical protein [Fusobacterium sp. DD40]MBR8775489.1 hypothetical protein [Fusobacterium sp. DD17]MBR8797751.1 hypothetical protein [Fusoba
MYRIKSNDCINYNPKNQIDDILRKVHMILRVYKYEQPLMRNFSIDSDVIDKNINVVRHKIFNDLLSSVRKYEPRVILKNVDVELEQDNNFNIILDLEVMQ